MGNSREFDTGDELLFDRIRSPYGSES